MPRHFYLLPKNLCSVKLLVGETLWGLQTEGETKGKPVIRSPQSPLSALIYFKVVNAYLWANRLKGLHYLSHLFVTVICGCIFLLHSRNEWQDALIVCFCLVCVLLVFSISVFLAPLWSRAHFCFVSLNIALIVALTEVKPLLISFVYIVRDTQRERGRERERERGKERALERRRGCDSDCSVWQRPSPVGVGRRERRLVFCLWQSGKSCHRESLGLPSGFLRLFCSQPAFEILSVTEHNTLQP